MADRTRNELSWDLKYLHDQCATGQAWYVDRGRGWWGLGRIVKSTFGPWPLSAVYTKSRTPMEYTEPDFQSEKRTSRPLKNTNELIHASVRTRVRLNGTGFGDTAPYKPDALANWTLHDEDPNKLPEWRHDGGGRRKAQGTGLVLVEAELGPLERTILLSDTASAKLALRQG